MKLLGHTVTYVIIQLLNYS